MLTICSCSIDLTGDAISAATSDFGARRINSENNLSQSSLNQSKLPRSGVYLTAPVKNTFTSIPGLVHQQQHKLDRHQQREADNELPLRPLTTFNLHYTTASSTQKSLDLNTVNHWSMDSSLAAATADTTHSTEQQQHHQQHQHQQQQHHHNQQQQPVDLPPLTSTTVPQVPAFQATGLGASTVQPHSLPSVNASASQQDPPLASVRPLVSNSEAILTSGSEADELSFGTTNSSAQPPSEEHSSSTGYHNTLAPASHHHHHHHRQQQQQHQQGHQLAHQHHVSSIPVTRTTTSTTVTTGGNTSTYGGTATTVSSVSSAMELSRTHSSSATSPSSNASQYIITSYSRNAGSEKSIFSVYITSATAYDRKYYLIFNYFRSNSITPHPANANFEYILSVEVPALQAALGNQPRHPIGGRQEQIPVYLVTSDPVTLKDTSSTYICDFHYENNQLSSTASPSLYRQTPTGQNYPPIAAPTNTVPSINTGYVYSSIQGNGSNQQVHQQNTGEMSVKREDQPAWSSGAQSTAHGYGEFAPNSHSDSANVSIPPAQSSDSSLYQYHYDPRGMPSSAPSMGNMSGLNNPAASWIPATKSSSESAPNQSVYYYQGTQGQYDDYYEGAAPVGSGPAGQSWTWDQQQQQQQGPWQQYSSGPNSGSMVYPDYRNRSTPIGYNRTNAAGLHETAQMGPPPPLVRTTALSQAATSLGSGGVLYDSPGQHTQGHQRGTSMSSTSSSYGGPIVGAAGMINKPSDGTQLRASLDIIGNLDDMAHNWTVQEWQARRRLVQFQRVQRGPVITVQFMPLDPAKYSPDIACISCIHWEEKNECYVTSVDCIHLLEQLVNSKFSVEEKNRIRRNLEGYHPCTVSKGKPESGNFFRLVMSFKAPRPRNIEKDVKVFPWRVLSQALQKIISKYSADYGHNTPR